MLEVNGIGTPTFSTGQFEALRKTLTKVQVLGGREPVIVCTRPTGRQWT